jgi:hypothetical protein
LGILPEHKSEAILNSRRMVRTPQYTVNQPIAARDSP